MPPRPARKRCAAAPSPLAWQAAGMEAPDRDQDAEEDGLRARRATGDVDVDREDPVDAAGAGVSLPDDAPGGGAGSHGDHDARIGDGLERAADGGLQVARDRAGDHDPVRVAWGAADVNAAAPTAVPRTLAGDAAPVP